MSCSCGASWDFFWTWDHLTWPGDVTLNDLGLNFLNNVWKGCVKRYAKNGGFARRRFYAIGEKPDGGVSKHPPPGPARVKGTCSPWKSWASDRKLLTRAPEKRRLHQNSQKINIFQNIKQRIYSFWRHFPHLRDAVIEVMVNRRHTRISNAVRQIWWLGP